MKRVMPIRHLDIAPGSPDRFGYEWNIYSELLPDYEEQFRRWTCLIPPEEWRGKTFLDVGCGMGRNSYWPLKYGAKEGVAIDVDQSSLKAARQNLAAFRHATVRALSAYDIDYTDRFDIVFSIGVIHHLEAPELALAEMVKAAKRGGQVLIWVYGLENNEWLVRFLNPLRRRLFSRLPISVTHHLSLYPAALLWLGLRLGVGRIEYFQLMRKMSFRHLRSVVFDQMLPKIANYWSRETVERLVHGAGLMDVRLAWVNEMSWTALGIKPPQARG
jgi:SAM-dependent methyltransferase